MHIPNGFLNPGTAGGLAAAAVAVLGYCFAKVRAAVTEVVPVLQKALSTGKQTISEAGRKTKRVLSQIGSERLTLMGIVGALVFAAQMFNFPIAEGTSGHLMGGVLAAVIVGPYAGTIIIAAILLIQSLFYADGGITALGANIFNMAIIGALGGYYVYYGIKKLIKGQVGFWMGVFAAAWLSVVAASMACAIEIAVSGTKELSIVFPAMVNVHMVIGLAEALITIVGISIFKLTERKLYGEE